MKLLKRLYRWCLLRRLNRAQSRHYRLKGEWYPQSRQILEVMSSHEFDNAKVVVAIAKTLGMVIMAPTNMTGGRGTTTTVILLPMKPLPQSKTKKPNKTTKGAAGRRGRSVQRDKTTGRA